jgi:tetratricopeptide (TPR) repeat protein
MIRPSIGRSAGALILGLGVSAAPTPARGEPEWVAMRSGHLTVISDAGEKRARQVALQFTAIEELFGSLAGARPRVTRPVRVFAMTDAAAMKELMPSAFRGKNKAHPAGVFVRGGDAHTVVMRVDVGDEHPYHVLYHEYVHLLNELSYRRLPLWLNEGLAEFYGSADIEEDVAYFGQLFPWHVALLRQRSPLPLDRFFEVAHSSPDYNERDRTGVFYAQAATLTHFFIIGDKGERRAALSEYARLVGGGMPEPEARRQALGDLKRLEKAYRVYLRRRVFEAFKLEAALNSRPVVRLPTTQAHLQSLAADFLAASGERKAARARLEAALAEEPQQAVAHRVLGRLLAWEGKTSEAVAALEKATNANPQDFLTWYRLGITDWRDNDAPSKARRERALRRAVELMSGYALARAALAETLVEAGGCSEEAITHARKARALEPTEASHALTLVRTYRACGRSAEASTLEAEMLSASLNDPGDLGRIVAFLKDAGRQEEAEAYLKKAREAQPGNVETLHALAHFFGAAKRHDEAEEALRAALAINPKDAHLLNDLAYQNADRNVRVEEALVLAERALSLRGTDDAAILDTRGWALFRLGRFVEAERDLRRAAAQADNVEILSHLGDVLAALGRPEPALAQWRRALELAGPDNELRPELEKKVAAAQASTGAAPSTNTTVP